MAENINIRRFLLLFGLITALGGSLWAAPNAPQPSVRPGINDYYANPDVATWVARFERPGREVYDQRHEIIAASGAKPGMVVADIGAGTGLFTMLFAPRVGNDGKVIAVDISRPFIRHIRKRAKAQGLSNIHTVINTQKGVNLPHNSVDLAFTCDTYHHFEFPRSMLRSIHRALRPNGKLIIVDFRKQPGVSSPWVLGHVRADKATVIREVEANGFRLLADKPLLKTNYFLVFQRRSNTKYRGK